MKKSLVVVVSVTLLVLTVSGLSYAYFKNYGITKEERLSVVAKKLAVIFTDDSELTGEIYPNYYESKTFSVENRSESLFKYDIIFEDLVNTFETEGFLQYKITSDDGGYSMEKFEDIPKSSEPTDTILAYSIEIENGVKHNYTLEIRYLNSETIDQSDDMGRVLSGNLAITEGTKNPKLKQVTLNVENGIPETSTIEVLENNDVTFEVEANDGYTTKGATLTCDNDYSTTINEETTSIRIPNITGNTTCILEMKRADPNFIAKLKEDNKTIKTRNETTFNSSFEVAGLYKESDAKFLESDGKTQNEVLYFAGNPNNNWVKFGKEGNDDIWWRIIRTNEDGSVRLLYAGKGTSGYNSTSGYISTSTYSALNNRYGNTSFVGYMYGATVTGLAGDRLNDTNSTIKDVVDAWYNKNLNGENTKDNSGNKYSSYLSRTAVYCNDRSTTKYDSTGSIYYAGYYRLMGGSGSNRPSFKCGNDKTGQLYSNADKADRFTGKQNTTQIKVGNQALGDAPIALITADEIIYAGGIYGNSTYDVYYYKNNNGDSVTNNTEWWTMTPNTYETGSSSMFVADAFLNPGFWSVDQKRAVRPVVSLKACVSVSGSGKTSDPYIPSIDDACEAADN